MQYVRSISGSVSKAWNSVNPATLSGAIDVIVVEQENGDLACSPFHVRFGKFSLLRPYEKKVEFRVNDQKTDYAMKLGEGGEAFFVFETRGEVPESLQTSPLVSPQQSPRGEVVVDPSTLQEPDYLDIGTEVKGDSASETVVGVVGKLDSHTPPPSSPSEDGSPGDWSHLRHLDHRSASEEVLPTSTRRYTVSHGNPPLIRPRSPDHAAAVERALALSAKLSTKDIPTQVTDQGDIMLDITGYKMGEEESLAAEAVARKILAEEFDGETDIGGLIGADRDGNVWIYASEEAKERADREASLMNSHPMESMSDGGYASDSGRSDDGIAAGKTKTTGGLSTPPASPPGTKDARPSSDSSRSYAKTLRLTSDQLKSLNLQPGENKMTFTVNRATCTAYMYVWRYNTPIVISDIDGTITKSDALGHVLTMIGRDWTHLGVAKLYTDIAANGYHMLYLTSRSVGQADSTRNYLNGIVQETYKLPRGPVIMSPDRTFSALRREVYLRKPEVFKMACLRDILNLFGATHNPFYAGFGNRLTDALSYRSVNIPSTRIFTINSYAEVSLDLLTLTRYKSSYVNMRDLVDHFFPPVERQVEQEYTDFNYWREPVDLGVDLSDLSDSDEEDDHEHEDEDEDEDEEGEDGEDHELNEDERRMVDSFISARSDYDDEADYSSSEDGEDEGSDDDDDLDTERPVTAPSMPLSLEPETRLATSEPAPDPSSEPEFPPATETASTDAPELLSSAAVQTPPSETTLLDAAKAELSGLSGLPHPGLPKLAMKIDVPGVKGMLGRVPTLVREEGKAVIEKVTGSEADVDVDGAGEGKEGESGMATREGDGQGAVKGELEKEGVKHAKGEK